MQTFMMRWGVNLLALGCLVMLYLIFTNRELPDISISATTFANFKTLFISLILEALPFILLGVLMSSLLQIFVSERLIRRLMPKNPLLGVMFACLLGVIFPLCECGMIPVVRRLIQKGMPLYVGIVYILAGPIINPVVFASTYFAFRTSPEIAYSRIALAFFVALAIGLVIYRFIKVNPLKQAAASAHEAHDHSHVHVHDHSHSHAGGNKVLTGLSHASDEFFEMGKYLMFGAFLTAAIQAGMNRETLVAIGDGLLGSNLFMMGFAYVLSICSTSDAFVAASFTTTFSAGSLLAFLVFGPMLDIKNTLMLLSVFKARFVAVLTVLVAVSVLAGSILFDMFILK